MSVYVILSGGELANHRDRKSDRLTEKEQAFRVRTVNQHLQESVK